MRIIAGALKGRRLKVPVGQNVRPTTGVIREAIFGIIALTDDVAFCDMFAGSGAVGIEALSRGAKNTVFVENDRVALQFIRENIAKCNLTERCTVMPTTAALAVQHMTTRGEAFDVIFADPPYTKGVHEEVLALFANKKLLRENGVLIIQHASHDSVQNVFSGLFLEQRRKYGKSQLSFYRDYGIEGG
ncbi:MAG: 16S rRNA (guanine(966)-N(2))-methyltransferase RsmD [Deltaproteobacteria bacterium]